MGIMQTYLWQQLFNLMFCGLPPRPLRPIEDRRHAVMNGSISILAAAVAALDRSANRIPHNAADM